MHVKTVATWAMVPAFALGMIVASAAPAKADIVLCTEDVAAAGCVATIPGTATIVGSDGESPFDPFGAGFDTSDGIDFTGQFHDYVYAGSPGWVRIDATEKWVLPADLSAIGCGVENETSCEPIGVWNWDAGTTWVAAVLGTYTILHADGSLSDIITLSNNAPGGGAQVTFQSDAGAPIPEPGSLVLFGTGLATLASRRRQMKRS
jgi:hypothetical protein